MIDFKNIKGIYFIGIGGIGMSALALYFNKRGYIIAGYDRTVSKMTDTLTDIGCQVSFEDNAKLLPDLFRKISNLDRVLIVYTPAIPSGNEILSYFRKNGYRLFKRSEVLGEISANTDTLAVAGTHGKTTISAMIAHLLKQSQIDCSAFLGGISKNYNSNFITGEGRFTVMEADEYDRSFHQLKPLMAVITALDDDHLDIYGDHAEMVKAYNEFCNLIRKGGTLIVNSKIRQDITVPEGVACYTYGPYPDADYRAFNIEHKKDFYNFNIKTPDAVLKDLHFAFPGLINIENLTAAIAIALNCGVSNTEIREALMLFEGVRRRFDIRINRPDLVYVDDYAHHPEEIREFIKSVREYFRGRRVTAIFQPHLFSRTRDHAEGFAASLDLLDAVIFLPIYAAREDPIEGVTSSMIMDNMKTARRSLLDKSDIPEKLDLNSLDVLLTIGAGDIDTLVGPIEDMISKAGVR
jgi:UDP-N-acetylmuramate--alanine ligase